MLSRGVGANRPGASSARTNAAPMPACATTVPRRTGKPPAKAIDEQQVQQHVDHVRHHHDHQRRAQVGHAAQVALAGQGYQRKGQAERADAQVEHGQVAGTPFAAHEADERNGQAHEHDRQSQADGRREPQRLSGNAPRRRSSPRAVHTRHLAVVP